MAKQNVLKGDTSRSEYIFIQDSSSTTGAGLTGLVFDSAGLAAYYVRERGTATAITLATLAAADSAWSSGGFKEVDATNMPGVYRLDVPNAAYATGVDKVVVMLKGAANMAPLPMEFQLVAYDPESATSLGLSKFADIETDTQDIQARIPAALVSGRIDASVGAMAANVVTAAAVADGAIDAATFAASAIDAASLAADAVTEIQSGLATAAALATVQSDTDNIQTRLPAALVGGRIDASVGAVAADAITAASIANGAIDAATFAADAIDAAALAADAVAEIQSGLATAAALATVQADTDDIQTRLPAALVGGRMDSSIGAAAANTLTASALAADAVTEIQSGLALSTQVDALEGGLVTALADLDDIQTRIPAALVGGRIDASVGAMASNTLTAAALAADAVAEVADAVWDELISGHNVTGSFGQILQPLRAGTAQAGSSSSITLDASASAINEFYRYALLMIVAGTGAGQARVISAYAGATKVATVPENFGTTPDATSIFVILPQHWSTLATASVNAVADQVWDEAISGHTTDGTFGQTLAPLRAAAAVGGGPTSISLDASASAIDDTYNDCIVAMLSGSSQGQVRLITDYDGASKAATVTPAWTTDPSGGDRFAVLPNSSQLDASAIAAIQSGLATAAALAVVQADTDNIQTRIPAALVGGKMDSTFDTTERTALTNAILDLASTVDTYTLRQIFRLMGAFGGGKSAGGASDDAIKAIDDSKTRITSTLDANGHRTAVTVDLT